MRFLWFIGLCLSVSALAQQPPKHLFRANERLTGPSRLAPRQIGRDFLHAQAARYRLANEDLDAAAVVREYRTEHNGVTHLVYRQQFEGVDVENAEWTVHIDRDGQVISAGGALARRPPSAVPAPDNASARSAVRAAAGAVNAKLAERFAPFESGTPASKGLRFAGSTFPAEIDAIPVWWDAAGELRPAWKFGITDEDGITRWAVVVDRVTRRILSKRSLTWKQSGPRGLVFEKGSPQPNPRPGVQLIEPPPVVERTLQPFTGDPVASPRGWVTGDETSGNNVIAGTNVLGFNCFAALDCLTRPRTSRAAAANFSFPLQVKENPAQFPDASTTSLFYWANRAHDWFYGLGFDEAAGNFQQENFHRGGIGGDPMIAYALFGVSAPGRADLNNAFFTSSLDGADGSQVQIAFLLETANGQFYDNAQDAATVVHEYGHGVTTRLVRQLSFSHHGGAMGEGWSDYFALEMLTPEGAPPDGVYPFSEYPDQLFGRGIRTRPYSTRMEVNPLTFAHLGRVFFAPEIHADGEIWFQALWEMRANLIRQLGEREGRRRANQLVVDGLKLCPPAPSMLDARDAILLADQVNFKGASQAEIWAGFARRGMGVLAMTKSGDTIHIQPSTETPSPRGSIQFYEDRYVIGETVTTVVQDGNYKGETLLVRVLSTAGDVENVILRRNGQVYTGSLETGTSPAIPNSGVLELIAGDFVTGYNNDSDAPGGPYLAQVSVPVMLDYDWSLKPASPLQFSGERPLGLVRTPFLPYELPWAFPFFGSRYKQVWVHNNGLLSFDFPSFAACPSAFGLWVTNGIAPLWMNLATDGAAQTGENVYVSQAGDSVTFRWAAETAPDFIGSRPEAVNFAATLYQDGRITFQYGGGNRNLTGGSNYLGCNASSPVVGLSNGHESFIQPVLTHDGKGTLENAPTVVLAPPFNPSSQPVVKLESPAPGDRVRGVLSGTGIVYDPDPEGGIRDVHVLIDGAAIALATLNRARPDFCNVERAQGCPNVGFSFLIPLERNQIKPGQHTLQLRAVNRRGYFLEMPERAMTFTVEPGDPPAPVSAIEAPSEGQEVSGTVTVRGYVYAPADRLVSVDVLVDGLTAGRATYGSNRSDVCAELSPGPPNCPRVGFAYTLNTRRFPNGPHRLSVRVVDEAGRYSPILPGSVGITINNTANEAPVGVITSPSLNQKVKGRISISGYAYAPAGAVERVFLLVDGFPMGALTYGTPRPEACAALSGVGACPNIGFEGDFDTARLSNGPHFINVVIEDDRGGVTDVPRTLSGGLDITVEN